MNITKLPTLKDIEERCRLIVTDAQEDFRHRVEQDLKRTIDDVRAAVHAPAPGWMLGRPPVAVEIGAVHLNANVGIPAFDICEITARFSNYCQVSIPTVFADPNRGKLPPGRYAMVVAFYRLDDESAKEP